MKICFVGFGSIASRHIRNIRAMFIGKDVVIDVLRSGAGRNLTEEQTKQIRHIYFSVDEISDYYDVIFITNPTKMHYETLKQLHPYGKHFFIEKPVFETGKEELDELNLREDSVYYVACPLRYTNVIQYIKRNVDFSKIYSIRSISSSYLPDWRPGTDYRDTYSAKKELGGGVSIDLIHEWDYLVYLLGKPEFVKCMIDKKSALQINSDDIALYIAEYPDKMVELHLDYFGRVPIRKIELFGKEEVIEADLIKETLFFKRSGRVIELCEDRDSYQKRELEHFFRLTAGEIENDNSIEEACSVLQIARGEY